MKRLKEIIITPLTDGVFSTLHQTSLFEFITDDNQHYLDIEYIYNHSGDKYISKLVDNLSNVVREDDLLNNICNVLITHYKDKWIKTYNAFKQDYDLLKPYEISMTESSDGNTKHDSTNTNTSTSSDILKSSGGYTDTNESTNSDTLTKTDDSTNTTSNDTTSKSSKSANTEQYNQVYGFNDSNYSPDKRTISDGSETGSINNTDKGTSTTKGTSSTNGTSTINGTSKRVNDSTNTTTKTSSDSAIVNESSSNSNTREQITKGNLSKSSQELISEEIELRKQDFFNIIFDDIDRLLTLSIY